MKRGLVITAKVHTSDLAQTKHLWLCFPCGVWRNLQQCHTTMLNSQNPANPAHIWINTLSVERHEREFTACRHQQLFNTPDANTRLARLSLPALLERGLCKAGMRVWLEAPHVSNTKTLKAIEPNPIADQCEKEELRAHIKDVTAHR